VTRWSQAERNGSPIGTCFTDFPTQAFQVIQSFLDEYLPELGEERIPVATTRICWYTDTFDNHFLIDRVPGKEGLMVATGGSGHAFKYLPCIGNWVVDIMENIKLDRPAVQAWKWRSSGEKMPINRLMQGSQGPRAFGNIALHKEVELKRATVSRL
jgi:sarcosine oxidase/L-pipecolate oxidase